MSCDICHPGWWRNTPIYIGIIFYSSIVHFWDHWGWGSVGQGIIFLFLFKGWIKQYFNFKRKVSLSTLFLTSLIWSLPTLPPAVSLLPPDHHFSMSIWQVVNVVSTGIHLASQCILLVISLTSLPPFLLQSCCQRTTKPFGLHGWAQTSVASYIWRIRLLDLISNAAVSAWWALTLNYWHRNNFS